MRTLSLCDGSRKASPAYDDGFNPWAAVAASHIGIRNQQRTLWLKRRSLCSGLLLLQVPRYSWPALPPLPILGRTRAGTAATNAIIGITEIAVIITAVRGVGGIAITPVTECRMDICRLRVCVEYGSLTVPQAISRHRCLAVRRAITQIAMGAT